ARPARDAARGRARARALPALRAGHGGAPPAVSLRDLLDAIDDRTGVRAAARRLAGLPVAGGAGWRHALGAALLALIALQVITGVGMAFYYSPSATTAWESVHHLEERVLLGRLLRGLHAFGASGVVVLLAAHVVWAG